MGRPELVIFDCDGVLVDSEVIAVRVLVANLARHGLALTEADAHAMFVGGTMANNAEVARAAGADLGPDWVAGIYAEIYAALRDGTPVTKGVPELLDRLDTARVPYCVASNGSEEKMQITLGQTGLWHRFQGAVFSAHTLGVAKPDPRLFLTAAGDVPPETCVVIEDSPTGVRAAIAAGMRCLAYAPEGDGVALAGLGAEVFTSMTDLPEMLHLTRA